MNVPLTLVPASEYPAALMAAVTGAGVVATGDPAIFRPEIPVAEIESGLLVASSGSSGKPKIVALSTRALLAAVDATNDRLGGPGDWVCALPIRFVAGTMTLVRALASGTEFHLVRSDLSDLPSVSSPTYLSLVPTQLDRALGSPEIIKKLVGYRAILIGGSALPPRLLARAQDLGLNIVATYGMAETAGGCVYDRVPLAQVTVQIGVNGQISLTTPTAFSGYRGRPELTKEVLDGQTVITADQGEFIDGRLTVRGRLDEVVIVGGVNVDLAGLRRRVADIWGPPESGVALVAVPDLRWGQVLVAVTTTDLPGTCDQLRDSLPDCEPEALPRRLLRLDSLPLLVSGKIDYRRLGELVAEAKE